MSVKNKIYCEKCKKLIKRGADAIVVVPPNYAILLGTDSVRNYHRGCAVEAGIDVSDVH